MMPIAAAPAIPGVKALATKACAKEISVGGIGKAKDHVISAVTTNRVPARRQWEVATKIVRNAMIFARNPLCPWRDLMRPIAIDHVACDLAFAAVHGDPVISSPSPEILRNLAENLQDRRVVELSNIGIAFARERDRSRVRLIARHRFRPSDGGGAMRALNRLPRNEAAFDTLKRQRDVVDHHRLPQNLLTRVFPEVCHC